jgi:hypothetical protein
MDSELIYSVLIGLFSVFALYFSIFVFTKQRVLNTEEFHVFRDMTPLPRVVNYWTVKLFVVFASLILLWVLIP